MTIHNPVAEIETLAKEIQALNTTSATLANDENLNNNDRWYLRNKIREALNQERKRIIRKKARLLTYRVKKLREVA